MNDAWTTIINRWGWHFCFKWKKIQKLDERNHHLPDAILHDVVFTPTQERGQSKKNSTHLIVISCQVLDPVSSFFAGIYQLLICTVKCSKLVSLIKCPEVSNIAIVECFNFLRCWLNSFLLKVFIALCLNLKGSLPKTMWRETKQEICYPTMSAAKKG